jgi:hypothetical protein
MYKKSVHVDTEYRPLDNLPTGSLTQNTTYLNLQDFLRLRAIFNHSVVANKEDYYTEQLAADLYSCV